MLCLQTEKYNVKRSRTLSRQLTKVFPWFGVIIYEHFQEFDIIGYKPTYRRSNAHLQQLEPGISIMHELHCYLPIITELSSNCTTTDKIKQTASIAPTNHLNDRPFLAPAAALTALPMRQQKLVPYHPDYDST